MNLQDLFRRWRALTHKDELDHELDEEMRFHLERDIEQNISHGMTPADARFAALRSFGGVDQSKEECRSARGVGLIDNLVRDVLYSVRVLCKSYAFTIVGVVTAVRHERMQEETRASVYLPHQKVPVGGMSLVARTSANPHEFIGAMRREVAQLDPDLPVREVATMEEVVAESIWQPRLYAMLFAVFAGGALLLALIGIYGVMAFLVQTRTHEIGVRMALGASARDVFRLIVGRGMKLTAFGVVIGVGGAIVLTRLMHSLLFNTSATDPFTFILLSLLLSIAAFLACYLPARRAAKVDPLVALRYE